MSYTDRRAMFVDYTSRILMVILIITNTFHPYAMDNLSETISGEAIVESMQDENTVSSQN